MSAELSGGERRGMVLLLSPYLFGLVALVALPAAVTFALSLFDYDLVRSPQYRGLGNYRELAADEVFRRSIWNSLHFAVFAVPLRLLGALALALLLHRRFTGVGAYRTAAYLPSVVPDIAFGLLWLWILNPFYGPLNLILARFGVPVAWLTSPTAARWAVIMMSLFTIGEGFLVAMATRQLIPEHLYEVAASEGAGPVASFRRVTLPLMAPTLLLLLFRDLVYSFQATFVPALIVTEGGPPPYATTYLPLFVYTQAFGYLRYGYAAAATVVMFAVTGLVVLVQWRVVRRWRRAFVV